MVKTLAAVLALIMAVLPIVEGVKTVLAENAAEGLAVGAAEALSGAFFTGRLGGGAGDEEVRLLLHGYSPVAWRSDLNAYDLDEQVVNGFAVTERQNGDRVYHIALHRDLRYCDGTPITAADYAFSILLAVAPEMDALCGRAADTAYIAGAEAYRAGDAPALSGVHVLNDYQFTLTVKAECLPCFYELAYLDFKPCPIGVLAPGCEVKDDGGGVYIKGDGFTVETLKKTILDPETGYQSHPRVTCGPYRLLSFADGTAEFAVNPCYKGDPQGRQPAFPRLILRQAGEEEMIGMLSDGGIDVLHRCRDLGALEQGLSLAGRDGYKAANYARSGLSLIQFCCERAAVASPAVRRAVAGCFDKDRFISLTAGRFGLRADGYWGVGQWIYQTARGGRIPAAEDTAVSALNRDPQFYADELTALEALRLSQPPPSAPDVETAIKLLEEDGWVLNEAGGAYSADTDAVRCRQAEGGLEKLTLTMVCPQEDCQAFEETLAEPLRQAGVLLTIESRPAEEIRALCSRQGSRDCDMIYTETDFGPVFDPACVFAPDGVESGGENTMALRDPALYLLAVEMRRTEPGDLAAYLRRWVAFQEAFASQMPAIPVMSSVYFDFWTGQMQEYRVKDSQSWAQAIVGSVLGEIVPEDIDGALQ